MERSEGISIKGPSSASVLKTFKALVDDAFRGAPLNVRQNKAAEILPEALKHLSSKEFKELVCI